MLLQSISSLLLNVIQFLRHWFLVVAILISISPWHWVPPPCRNGKAIEAFLGSIVNHGYMPNYDMIIIVLEFPALSCTIQPYNEC